MEIAGPAFIHCLGLHLWNEIFHLFVHHRHHVALPGLEMRRIAHDVIDDILLGKLICRRPFFFYYLRLFLLAELPNVVVTPDRRGSLAPLFYSFRALALDEEV